MARAFLQVYLQNNYPGRKSSRTREGELLHEERKPTGCHDFELYIIRALFRHKISNKTRDMKLIPKAIRAELYLRRTCRKKIHQKITAVFAMMTALQKSESNKSYKHDLAKAVEKLGKVHKEADIRSYMDKLLQKNGADMAEKEAKREGKMRIRRHGEKY